VNYTQLTARDREEMLRAIGVATVDDLLVDVPAAIRFRGRLDVPDGLPEQALQRALKARAERNRDAESWPTFLGAGLYDHHIPVIVDPLVQRGEFLTSYTPYQAEASQGTLQAIFEFQTMIASLTGMEVANASMYDGGTALAEAVFLGLHTRPDADVVVLSEGIHPAYREIVRTYLDALPPMRVVTVPLGEDGRTDPDAFRRALGEGKVAAACVQTPSFFGVIEDVAPLLAAARESGTTAVAVTDLVACVVMEPPGALGADVVVGEGQSAGVPLSFGGPGYGFFAVRKDIVRKMPGRLVGLSADADGQPAFTLTLSTREQHIRRAKATSNICTNTGLMALRGCVHLTAFGPEGLREVGAQCMAKTAYAAERASRVRGCSLRYEGPYVKEFVVTTPVPAARVLEAGREAGLVAGFDLGRVDPERDHELLVAVTERRTREDIDRWADVLAQAGARRATRAAKRKASRAKGARPVRTSTAAAKAKGKAKKPPPRSGAKKHTSSTKAAPRAASRASGRAKRRGGRR
jgi:glycine dehydrogenase subunit 1